MQRFALIGAGFIGSVHAANLAANPAVDFAFVYDVDTARADLLASKHGARVATDIAQVFDADTVDALARRQLGDRERYSDPGRDGCERGPPHGERG